MSSACGARGARDACAARDSRDSRSSPRVIIVDGEIGAGKTTFIQHLSAATKRLGLKTAVVSEPVGIWSDVGILQEFYAADDAAKKHVAYAFQTFTFVTRVQETVRVFEENPDADVFILERSVLTDRFIFMELQRELVGETRMKMYETWWETWQKLMPFEISGKNCREVYLKPKIESCQARVASRAREGEIAEDGGASATAEGGVSAQYQSRLRRAHEAFLEGKHPEEFSHLPRRPFDLANVVVIDGHLVEDDFSGEGEAADRITAHVIERAGLEPASKR